MGAVSVSRNKSHSHSPISKRHHLGQKSHVFRSFFAHISLLVVLGFGVGSQQAIRHFFEVHLPPEETSNNNSNLDERNAMDYDISLVFTAVPAPHGHGHGHGSRAGGREGIAKVVCIQLMDTLWTQIVVAALASSYIQLPTSLIRLKID